MFTTKDYAHEISLNATWRKYDSPANLQRILSFLAEAQWLPSQVTVERALGHLRLPRTDGGSALKDANAAKRAAQTNFDAACAAADALPLNPQELREFSALSFADLQRRYWSEDADFFRVRFNKAAREFGYRIPEKPSPSVEVEDGGEIELTAEQYHAMPARELQIKLRNPRFKLQVMQLIKSGAIR
jgi:hypothetical protein